MLKSMNFRCGEGCLSLESIVFSLGKIRKHKKNMLLLIVSQSVFV